MIGTAVQGLEAVGDSNNSQLGENHCGVSPWNLHVIIIMKLVVNTAIARHLSLILLSD